MSEFDCDLFVIGGGSGGVRAARMAAQRGARVMLAEAADLGGACVNVGCIPKKLFSHAAEFAQDLEDAAGFGWDIGRSSLDWQRLKANRSREIKRLNGVYERLLVSAGVELLHGWALIAGEHEVSLRGEGDVRLFTARHILIATGSSPAVPSFPGREHVLTSDDMFDLEHFPERLVVVGAGYIACEFSSIFNGLGADVLQIVRGPQLLRGFDDDVRDFIAREMGKHGVSMRFQTNVLSVEKVQGALRLTLDNGEVVEADAVLHATGRAPNVHGLELGAVGVRYGLNGGIEVDAHNTTSVPSIHAVGDVTARVQLTPVALAEAMVVVEHLFGNGLRRLDYDLIPTAVFTHPSVGTVGLTEGQARIAYPSIRIFRSEFKALKHTLSGRDEKTLMKLVVDAASDVVVGLHMVGAEAAEIVQGFAVAMKAGATKSQFDATIGIHPTAAEEFVTMRNPLPAQ